MTNQEKEEYLGITIDYTRDNLFDKHGLARLKDSYMRVEETSPQHRFAFVANTFGSDQEHKQALYEYSSKHWLSFATPILAFGRTNKGLPISCFLPYVDDTIEGLVDTLSETNWLSVMGGGVGLYFGIRSADDKSTGVLSHLKTYDACALAYRQGKTRRGSYAAYLDISHPDIQMFIEIRKPTGDPRFRCMNIHNGINITDDFMLIIERCMLDPKADDSWPLVDPKTKEVVSVVSAKELWQKILTLRMETGEPYLHFIDASNRALPIFLKEKGLSINQSNLCSEIILPTNSERTAVCCLSSLNIEYFEEWKNEPKFLYHVAKMLDNVLQYFIDNAPDTIKRAKYSAMMERSIGIGELGFHAFLQSKMVPFESVVAKGWVNKIETHITNDLYAANIRLGEERGEAPDTEGTGYRFSHTRAVAPNASTSIIVGNTSASVEPFPANAYRQDTLSGSMMAKNKYLDKIILEKLSKKLSNMSYDEIWSSIISNDGSVQHLEFLTKTEKDVFKTAFELDQTWIIELASTRQIYIDQSQSINLFFYPDVNIKYLHAIHFLAWKKGMKTLYYCRSKKIAKADNVSESIERKKLEESIDLKALVNDDECIACQG